MENITNSLVSKKRIYSLIMAILCLILGGLPYIKEKLNITSFDFILNIIPESLLGILTLEIILVIAGIVLLLDSLSVGKGFQKLLFLILGLVLLIAGTLPLVNTTNLLDNYQTAPETPNLTFTFLSFLSSIAFELETLRLIALIFGILLLIGLFAMKY